MSQNKCSGGLQRQCSRAKAIALGKSNDPGQRQQPRIYIGNRSVQGQYPRSLDRGRTKALDHDKHDIPKANGPQYEQQPMPKAIPFFCTGITWQGNLGLYLHLALKASINSLP